MPIEALLAYFTETNEPRSESTPHLQVDPLGTTGFYRGMRLSSVFQPLFAADSLKARAYEALLRVRDEHNLILSPAEAFSRPVGSEQIVYFDRLCRIMHALNFQRQADRDAELFLNVSGRHLQSLNNGQHGETFERLLAQCGLKPEQIILEVLEARVEDIEHFNEAVEAYRSRGYRVAIDDFGCEHSNFDRLWRLTPDIVKLDRSLILQGTTNPRARRILPKLIEIIHDLGATVVCEGIESRDQHSLAVDAGADLLQGFHYARPAARLQDTAGDADTMLTSLEYGLAGIR
ncbi:MAG: EAL domain-containing protein [Rhodocyclales bacterium GT-UBC]|nr:MAG: EAL domain-containing protein [Rhodocyclales bacterium GT-UBC]